jgi:hypothetical protein
VSGFRLLPPTNELPSPESIIELDWNISRAVEIRELAIELPKAVLYPEIDEPNIEGRPLSDLLLPNPKGSFFISKAWV